MTRLFGGPFIPQLPPGPTWKSSRDLEPEKQAADFIPTLCLPNHLSRIRPRRSLERRVAFRPPARRIQLFRSHFLRQLCQLFVALLITILAGECVPHIGRHQIILAG